MSGVSTKKKDFSVRGTSRPRFLTNDVILQQYEAAKAKLLSIAFSTSPSVTPEQIAAAERALDDLTEEYIGITTNSIHNRPQQFQNFIDLMERAIADLSQKP